MSDAFKRLINELLTQGITEEAFDNLCEVVLASAAWYEGVTLEHCRGWLTKEYVDDLINRSLRRHYPHGYRIEFREGGRYDNT